MKPLRLLAPAKINLHLRVGPVQRNGFHPLMSWMCTVGLFDTLTIDFAPDGSPWVMQCDDERLPCDETNLVIRAARAMQRESETNRSATIRLEKRIPTGGGLGGGSSDAARTLLSLNQLWDLRWPIDRLVRIAADLGSDVPFFLHGPSSVCTGRGEMVRPIARPKPRWAVLILPRYGISTQAVYGRYDEMGAAHQEAIETKPDWQQWADLSAGPLLARLVNDLEPPAFALCPQLAELRSDIEQAIGRPVRMSGSGSSLFTIFDENDEALSAAARIEQKYGVRAIATQLAPQQIDDDLKSDV
jgi:4-diphosphocytidyl-2-C-methyl-D-erythritol kinase